MKKIDLDLSALIPIVAIIMGGIIAICLIPNSPRIVINPKPIPAKVETNRLGELPCRRSLGFFEVTAYCPNECCCGEYADGITANGHIILPDDRFCATDPSIPFGKYLDIPGYGYVPVYDRGGKIKGNKIDVFFPTHDEALEWGNQTLEIFCWIWSE